MRIFLLLTISMMFISCKFGESKSEVKKISYEDEYNVEFIMDYDKDCKVGHKKLNSPACAKASKKYCQNRFGSKAIGMPLSMSKIGITVSCISSEDTLSVDKAYLQASNSKCNFSKNWKSASCQYTYQEYCRKSMQSANPDGRHKYTAIATDLIAGKAEISCVKVSQENSINRIETLTAAYKCDLKDLTSEACLSSYHDNCPKDRMIGMLNFEENMNYNKQSAVTLSCINSFSVNEKLFARKVPVYSQVAECLEEARSGKLGTACMGDVYESDFGLDPYNAIGSNYVERFTNRMPVNGFDGDYYVDWTFSEKQRILIRNSLDVYKDWISKKELRDCAFNRGFFGGPGFRKDVDRVFDNLSREKSNLFVFRTRNYNSSPGKSRLKVQEAYAHKNVLQVGLNTLYMSDVYDVGKHPAFWAGIILHQALHSRGFVHDSDKGELSYSSFTVEAGKCLQELEENVSGKPQNEGRVALVDRWHDDFMCPVRAYKDNSLPFEVHDLDVLSLQTVADDRVSGTCFQEDKFYNYNSLKSFGFNDSISRVVVEPGHEVCLFSDSNKLNSAPDCCMKVDQNETQAKLYDVFKDSMFFNSNNKAKISAVIVSPYGGEVPYKKSTTPECGVK